jgi:hypothetical protein
VSRIVRELTADVLPHVTEHVRIITCEAFDELGFVFWETASVQ